MALSVTSIVLLAIYGLICFVSIFANILFLVAVKANKKLQSIVFVILANQCVSDLLIVALSIFNIITFALNGKWLFGDVFCKIQAALIETSYTVSILSLCVVALQRYLLICRLKRNKPSLNWCLRQCLYIWVAALLICLPLFYAYKSYDLIHVTENSITYVESGQVLYNITGAPKETVKGLLATREPFHRCGTRCHIYRYENAALIYQCIHYAIVYFLPLATLVFSHVNIIHTLQDAKKKLASHMPGNQTSDKNSNGSNSNTTDAMNSNGRHPNGSEMNSQESHSNDIEMNSEDQSSNEVQMQSQVVIQNMKRKEEHQKNSYNLKISKLLVTITVIFIILWSPYNITRIIVVVKPHLIPNIVFTVFQLLILASTVPNFFIALGMSNEFKSTIKNLFRK